MCVLSQGTEISLKFRHLQFEIFKIFDLKISILMVYIVL